MPDGRQRVRLGKRGAEHGNGCAGNGTVGQTVLLRIAATTVLFTAHLGAVAAFRRGLLVVRC